jgi:hypothetical protein
VSQKLQKLSQQTRHLVQSGKLGEHGVAEELDLCLARQGYACDVLTGQAGYARDHRGRVLRQCLGNAADNILQATRGK